MVEQPIVDRADDVEALARFARRERGHRGFESGHTQRHERALAEERGNGIVRNEKRRALEPGVAHQRAEVIERAAAAVDVVGAVTGGDSDHPAPPATAERSRKASSTWCVTWSGVMSSVWMMKSAWL